MQLTYIYYAPLAGGWGSVDANHYSMRCLETYAAVLYIYSVCLCNCCI